MIRVACTALLKRIVAGRPNKDGTAMVGGGEDVTSDCIKAIIEFVGVGGIHEVTVDGKPMYEIEIRTAQPVEQTRVIPDGDCDPDWIEAQRRANMPNQGQCEFCRDTEGVLHNGGNCDCPHAVVPPYVAAQPVEQTRALTDDVLKLIECAADCISESVRYDQDRFDTPPMPATEWDYNADQLAYALRALLTAARPASGETE